MNEFTGGLFRVDWIRGVLSPTTEKLEGSVYNNSPCSMANVRIHVVGVDAGGRRGGRPTMTTALKIRPDVHARFRALVARVDAKVQSERETLQRRLMTARRRASDGRARHHEDEDRAC